MKFRAVQDSEYVRSRDGLIAKAEQRAYELTKHMPEGAVRSAAYSRIFSNFMQDEAERLHLTDGMVPCPIVALAHKLKIPMHEPPGGDDATD
jgi:hypothetical protein